VKNGQWQAGQLVVCQITVVHKQQQRKIEGGVKIEGKVGLNTLYTRERVGVTNRIPLANKKKRK